jgi:hypothetical protein
VEEAEPPSSATVDLQFNDPYEMTTRRLTENDIQWATVLVPEALKKIKDAQDAFKTVLSAQYPLLMKGKLDRFPCPFASLYTIDMDNFAEHGPIGPSIKAKKDHEKIDFPLLRTGLTFRLCSDALKKCEKKEDMFNTPKMPFVKPPLRVVNGKEEQDPSSMGPNFFLFGRTETNMLTMSRETRVKLQLDLDDVYPQIMKETLSFIVAAADSEFYRDIPEKFTTAIAVVKEFMAPELWEFNPTQQASNGEGLSDTSVSLPHGQLRPRLKKDILVNNPELNSAWTVLMEEAFTNMQEYKDQMILVKDVLESA